MRSPVRCCAMLPKYPGNGPAWGPAQLLSLQYSEGCGGMINQAWRPVAFSISDRHCISLRRDQYLFGHVCEEVWGRAALPFVVLSRVVFPANPRRTRQFPLANNP